MPESLPTSTRPGLCCLTALSDTLTAFKNTMDTALCAQTGHLATSSRATTESYTLETIYDEAMEEVKALHASGKLPDEYYNIISGMERPEDLHVIIEEENKRRVEGQTRAKRRINSIVPSTVKKLERYVGAIDMIAQSSPQALGLNIVGLVWGSLKVLMIIAQDIDKSFEMINQTLHDLGRSLPILGSLTKLYGTSEVQLLRQPLVDIYASIVSLALVVIRLCKRGPLDTLGRSVWNSLQGDLNASIARLEKAGKLVEQAACVEHMHATKIIGTEQEREIHRQERFRRGKICNSFSYTCNVDGYKPSIEIECVSPGRRPVALFRLWDAN